MNDRIKELWEKAAESTAAYPSGQNNSWETQVNFMEKFAELIVRECVDVCNKIYFEHYPDAEEWERSEEGDAIKKHLGVEE